MAKRNKAYIPKPSYNSAVQARKLEKISRRSEEVDIELSRLKKFMDALDKSHSNHITYLGNFARHDIKNAVQSIDSIVSTTEPEEFTSEKIASLKLFLEVIRLTLDNFAKLVPYSSVGNFNLSTLIVGAKILNRVDAEKNHIETRFVYPTEDDGKINLPFQSILQMLNNLLINAVKALENTENKKILVEGEISGSNLVLKVYDNGKEIPETDQSKIFEYGFTTTNGSGIGLFHATHLCTKYSGEIQLKILSNDVYNKVFIVTLPTNSTNGEEHSDH